MSSVSSVSVSVEPGQSSRLRVVFVGHVDHGKSTLIGRIFWDTNSLPEGKKEQIEKASAEEGMQIEYSFLLDSLLEEQEQNITIDTTQIQFKTAKRPYVIIDAPGHKEFLKNMITGAASADAAVLLIAANEGVQEQSRRHGYLLSLLGIRQVVVAVNKMDLVGYSKEVFDKVCTEYRAFLSEIGVEARAFVPISARNGVNVATRGGDEAVAWYTGPSVLDMLDTFEPPAPLTELPLRLPIQDIYRFDDRRLLVGRIETGTLRVGDKLIFSPNEKTSEVASIENWNCPNQTTALAGESVAITLKEQIFVERGHVASHAANAPIETNRFRARLFWMGKRNLVAGQSYKLKLATQELDAEVVSIERIIDASTLETGSGDRGYIAKNDVAEITIQTRGALVMDNADRNPFMGRFVIVDERQVAGGGIVFGGVYVDRTQAKSANIYWSEGNVLSSHRALRNGHRGAVLWLTGLSGSGKSTLARAIERELFNGGRQVYVLDGDNLRHGLNANLGFSPEDRVENIRRVAEVAKIMANAGLIVVTAFISPYLADRRRAREIVLESGQEFAEVYVEAPLETCEKRDVKGLYKRARAGEIAEFTGISAPYEAPENPEVVVKTDLESVEGSVASVLEYLLPRIRLVSGDEISI
ncbi:MAG: adenylyl-sulfate kinase [Verrucomicrobiota bacterium]